MATNDSLAQKVEQFKQDVDIVHLVTHGDETTTVQTENGPISSLAKLIHDAGLTLDDFKFSLVTSTPLVIQDGMFRLQSPAFGNVVWNMAMVFLDLVEEDFFPDGTLKCDREYDIEEHIGITVSADTMTVNIAGDVDYLNGKHAQVTYLTCLK